MSYQRRPLSVVTFLLFVVEQKHESCPLSSTVPQLTGETSNCGHGKNNRAACVCFERVSGLRPNTPRWSSWKWESMRLLASPCTPLIRAPLES